MQNYVITITRQFGSRGRDIGVAAAKKLGIPLYDRNVLEKEAEEIDSTLHSLVEFSKNGMSESGYYKMAYPLGIGSALKKDRMFELQSKLVLKHAESENCVIIGRCADYLLRERENVIRCYIFAPYQARILQQHHDAGTRQRRAAAHHRRSGQGTCRVLPLAHRL